MGRSRNKVAVPEGAAGIPPFWRFRKGTLFLGRTVGVQDRDKSFFSREDYRRDSSHGERVLRDSFMGAPPFLLEIY